MKCPKCGGEITRLPDLGIGFDTDTDAPLKVVGWIAWCPKCGYEEKVSK